MKTLLRVLRSPSVWNVGVTVLLVAAEYAVAYYAQKKGVRQLQNPRPVTAQAVR